MYSDLAHWYGFTPNDLEQMTTTQIDMYASHVSRLLFLQHYPVASALAHWANANGGKSPKGAKTLPPEKTFKPEDFMHGLARYGPYLERSAEHTPSMGIDRETAQLILSLNTHEIEGKRSSLLEPWMIGALAGVWEELMAAA